MIARADAAKIPVPKLRTAYTHLKAYEKMRG
jgi:2-dehydropantoate 2-reductase